jgi:hypothetical protein
MMVKIEIRNTNKIFIEEWSWKKINLIKDSKKIKRIRIKLKKISQIGLNDEIEKKNQSFIKNPRIKIRNQKNKNWSRNSYKSKNISKTLHD